MTKFSGLGLHPLVLKNLEKKHYKQPTPIQENAIPKIMSGVDVLGLAQTGTGKTAAFALPIISKLINDKKEPVKRGCRVLVIAPTRELVNQIYDNFMEYGQGLGLKLLALYGGVAHKPQINFLIRGIDVLIATPGRLMDHINDGNARLKTTEILVLDEVDQMLDLGFVGSIRKIAAKIGDDRQNLFFSATMPKEIEKLAAELLNEPKRVEVAPVSSAQELVEQEIMLIENNKKKSLLVDLLENQHLSRVMIFTRTKHGADKVSRFLSHFNIKNGIVHGGKSQPQREKTMQAFRDGKMRALVATDVAARGIDIADVSHVINFDMPVTPEAYIHRIGRTARGGKGGISISFCSHHEVMYLREIEKLIKKKINTINKQNDKTLLEDAKVAIAPAKKNEDEDRRESKGKFAKTSKHRKGNKFTNIENEKPDFSLDVNDLIDFEDKPWDGEQKPKKDKKSSNSENPSFAARPNGRSDRFRDDKPRGERARSDRPRGDRSRSDGRRSERPRSNDVRFEGRSERPRSNDSRFEGRSERPRSSDSRFEGRSERPRSNDSRFEGGRSERPRSNDSRFEGRSERPRSNDSRFEGRSERPRSNDSRFEGGRSERPRSNDSRFEGRSERPRSSDSRFEGGRSEARSDRGFKKSGDRRTGSQKPVRNFEAKKVDSRRSEGKSSDVNFKRRPKK